MLVSCREDSRKSALEGRNVKVACQAALVLFTGPTNMARLCMCNDPQKHDNSKTDGKVVAGSARGLRLQATYLAQLCSCVDILFDAVKDRAVVLQVDAVSISAAALQCLRLAGSHRQGVQIQPLGMRIGHDETATGWVVIGVDWAEQRAPSDRAGNRAVVAASRRKTCL